MGTVFHSYANFNKAQFCGLTDFTNAIFKSTTNFTYAVFDKPPRFHKVDIHQDTSFYNAKYRAISGNEDDVRAWRTLKLAMNKTHNHDQELLYYSYENDAKLNVFRSNKDILKYIPLRFYKLSSDYGQSLLKPFIALFLIFLIFSGFYDHPVWGKIDMNGIESMTWSSKLVHSVKQHFLI